MGFLRILWQARPEKIKLRKSKPRSRRGAKEMLKKYESPELDVIELEDRDVIVASGVSGGFDGPGGIESGDGEDVWG